MAHLPLRGSGSAIVAGSDHTLLFGGKPGVSHSARARATSDPVDLAVPALSELAISLYVPGATGPPSIHVTGCTPTYVSKQGDVTGQPVIENALTTQSWYWLSSVYVAAPANAAAIVAFGDSITDGTFSTPDTNSAWPVRLARRILASPETANLAVLDQGIRGNKILRDGLGLSALGRMDEDVFSQAGVSWVILLEGINDIGHGLGPDANGAESVDAEDVIRGMRQFVEQAHLRGIKVMGGTMTPYAGAPYLQRKGRSRPGEG